MTVKCNEICIVSTELSIRLSSRWGCVIILSNKGPRMLTLILLFQSTAAQPLNLTCVGAGTANKIAVTNVYGSGRGNGTVGTTPYSYSSSGNAIAYSSRQQDFADQVDVRLFSGDDRIRMPRTMLPAIRGGDGGWFKL